MRLRDLQLDCYRTAKQKGFHDAHNMIPSDFASVWISLGLITSEVAEAMEELRDLTTLDGQLWHLGPNDKPEGLGSELADVVIRTLDLCGRLGLDLEEVMEAKMAYNTSRPPLHGRTA